MTGAEVRSAPLLKTNVNWREPDPRPQVRRIEIERLTIRYGARAAVDGVTVPVFANLVTAIIGPSGCGKSTLLRALNRMNDSIPGVKAEGRVLLDGMDIYAPGCDVIALRRRVGMVFQQANPFPKSIYDNVAFGLRINALARSRSELAGGAVGRRERPAPSERTAAFRGRAAAPVHGPGSRCPAGSAPPG